MTWSDQYRQLLLADVRLKVRFKRNLKTYYKKFPHKATFEFKVEIPDNSRFNYHGTRYATDWSTGTAMFDRLSKAMKTDVRGRMGWVEGYVYFSDYEDLISNLTEGEQRRLRSVEIMPEENIAAIKSFKHEYPVVLSVVKNLPADEMRYKVFITASSKVRKRIGEHNLVSILNLLKSYDGVKFTESFERMASRQNVYSSGGYFYSKDLEWLPMVAMMDPRYIKQIEQLKTETELKDEIASKNTD